MWALSLIAQEQLQQHAYALKSGRDFRNVSIPKKVPWIRVPLSVVSAAQKLVHDRGMARRPKLFVLMRRLHEQGPQPKNFVLSSSFSEDVFCNLKTRHDKRMAPRQSCLFQEGYHSNKGHQPRNCPGFESQ